VRVPVELGRSSVNVIEITRGLAVGDKIIVSDMSQYANAARVRIKSLWEITGDDDGFEWRRWCTHQHALHQEGVLHR
jgi:hypothetical protein